VQEGNAELRTTDSEVNSVLLAGPLARLGGGGPLASYCLAGGWSSAGGAGVQCWAQDDGFGGEFGAPRRPPRSARGGPLASYCLAGAGILPPIHIHSLKLWARYRDC